MFLNEWFDDDLCRSTATTAHLDIDTEYALLARKRHLALEVALVAAHPEKPVSTSQRYWGRYNRIRAVVIEHHVAGVVGVRWNTRIYGYFYVIANLAGLGTGSLGTQAHRQQ